MALQLSTLKQALHVVARKQLAAVKVGFNAFFLICTLLNGENVSWT